MKIYVINVESESDRLQAFADSYPACLPQYTVWEAKTGEDVVKPDWWGSSANRWALVQNFIDILSEDNDEDVLIFEDDCTFAKDFEEKYNAFLNEVPDDWDMLYLGAQHVAAPTQVTAGVLQLKNSICGHAIIYRNRIKQELAAYYQEPRWGCMHMPDQRRGQAMASGKFKAYAPLVNICGQAKGYSILSKRERKARWYNSFRYITSDGFLSEIENGKQKITVEPVDTIPALAGKEICSVSVYGDNIFYAVTFMLKFQELQQAFNMPVVCHVDTLNKERIEQMARQENIDISDVIFIEHEYISNELSQFWRYIPLGASVTHVFDVDNKLHPAHIDAIEDFRIAGEDFDVYTCKYVRNTRPVLAGAIGFRDVLLTDLFGFLNRHTGVAYGTDEIAITDFISRNEMPCLVYRTKGCKHKGPESWIKKNIDMQATNMHYKSIDFERLAYYASGVYHIENKEYPVTKEWNK